MATTGISSSEALRRGLNTGDETPRGIMALGAFIDTFVSGGGCSTAQPECRPFDRSRRGGCLPVKCNVQKTLSWDDSTLDTMDASEESSQARSHSRRPASPTSAKKHSIGVLKRKKSEEELSQLAQHRVRSDDKSECRTVESVSEAPSVPNDCNNEQPLEEPKSIWSTDLLSNSFDQLQRSFSLENVYERSIFQTATMESVDNTTVDSEVPTTSKAQPFRRQSTPSPLKQPYSSLADALEPRRSFRRHSTPKLFLSKKPRLVSPNATPKAYNSHHRRTSSSSPLRSRNLFSFRHSQNSRRKSDVPRDDDSILDMSSSVRASKTLTGHPSGQGSVVDGGGWNCSTPQPPKPNSFWNLELPTFLCGQGFQEEPSFGKETISRTAIAPTTSDPIAEDVDDLIMKPSLTETTAEATTQIPPSTTPSTNDIAPAVLSTEQPFVKNQSHDSDILAKASVEQTLQDVSLEKKINPLKAIFRTTTGILSKLTLEYKVEDHGLETPPIQKKETNDTDILATTSVEQSLEEANTLAKVAPNDNITAKADGALSRPNNDPSCDLSLDQTSNPNLGIDEVGVEPCPIPVTDDRMGDLEQQVQELMNRIRQLEHGIKETTVQGQEKDHDAAMANDSNDMELHVDEIQLDQQNDHKLKQAIGNETLPDELFEEAKSPVVSGVEMPAPEYVSVAAHDAQGTTRTKKEHFELANNMLEASEYSTMEENRTNKDCTEEDGIEVDFSDFVCTNDRITTEHTAGNAASREQAFQQSKEVEEGIEISMIDLQHILNSNPTNQLGQISIQNSGNCLTESSCDEVSERTNKKKKGGVVSGLKKKLLRVTSPRTSKSRMKSIIQGHEVMPMTGVFGANVGSEVSSVSSLVSSEGRSSVKETRGRYRLRRKSCEASLATGATTLPTSNVILSFKV